MKENSEINSKIDASPTVAIDVKMDAFRLRSVLDFNNEFDADKWALKSLAELIRSSDLEFFSDSGITNQNYRWGLQQLIELCVEKQEKNIKELSRMVLDSPEFILERAKNIKEIMDHGDISQFATKREIFDVVEGINTVIDLFGQEEYPEALIIRNQILSKIPKKWPTGNQKNNSNGTDG